VATLFFMAYQANLVSAAAHGIAINAREMMP
jgi:hypothetical protein